MYRSMRWVVAVIAVCSGLAVATNAAVAEPVGGMGGVGGVGGVGGATVNVETGWATPGEAPLVVPVPVPAPVSAVIVPPVEAGFMDGATGSSSNLPFDYRSRFYDKIRGRDMTTYNGTFCNLYHLVEIDNDAADAYTDIQLVLNVNNGYDRYYERVRYPNDGGWWKYCWTGHSTKSTYHFDYIQADPDWALTMEGRADGK